MSEMSNLYLIVLFFMRIFIIFVMIDTNICIYYTNILLNLYK